MGVVSVRNSAAPYSHDDLFAEAAVDPFPLLRLTAGVRVNFNTDRILFDGEEGEPTEQRQLSGGVNVVPRMGLIANPFEGHFLKVLYGESIQQPRITYAAKDWRTEHIRSSELNYLWVDRLILIETSLFHQTISGVPTRVQSYDPASGAYISDVVAEGLLRVVGVEALLEVEPIIGLRLGASTTLQDVEDQRAPHVEPGNAPSSLFKARASYKYLPWTFGAYASYVGAMLTDWRFTDLGGEVDRLGDAVPGYVLLGLNVRYDHVPSGMYGNLHVSNVLDTDVRYPANELVGFQGGGFGPRREAFFAIGLRL